MAACMRTPGSHYYLHPCLFIVTNRQDGNCSSHDPPFMDCNPWQPVTSCSQEGSIEGRQMMNTSLAGSSRKESGRDGLPIIIIVFHWQTEGLGLGETETVVASGNQWYYKASAGNYLRLLYCRMS